MATTQPSSSPAFPEAGGLGGHKSREDVAGLKDTEEVKQDHLSIWNKKKLNTDLFCAILESDTSRVECLLGKGASALARCRSELVSASHLAALRGEEEILQELMKSCKASTGSTRLVLDARDARGRQPHHLAAAAGQLGTLTLILEEEPELIDSQVMEVLATTPEEFKDLYTHRHSEIDKLVTDMTKGSTAFHLSARFGFEDCIKFLHKKGANINIQDERHRTPLDVAGTDVQQKKSPFLGFPSSESRGGASPFSMPHGRQQSQAVNKDTKGRTQLGLKQIAKFMISWGGMSNNPDCNTSPLHKAVLSGSADDVREILRNDQMKHFIGTLDENGKTPVHIAVKLKKIDHLKVLLELEKDAINSCDIDGNTPLLTAVDDEWIEGISELLEQKPSFLCTNLAKENVLHIVAKKGNTNILNDLLSVTNDVLIDKDNDGYTPIARAIVSGNLSCAEVFLDTYNKNNKTHGIEQLVNFALKNKSSQMLNFFKERYNLTPSDFNNMNSLHMAAVENNIECLRYLLSIDNGNIMVKSFIGRNPLISAASKNHTDCVLELLKNGANLAAIDNESKKTAVDFVFETNKQRDIILEDLFGSCLQESSRCVSFKFLLADAKEANEPQLGVVDAFSRSSNEKLRKKFFLHPLVETFLYFKWKKLKSLYYLYLSFFIIHIFFNTFLVLALYIYHLNFAAEFSRIALCLSSLPVIIFEGVISGLKVSYLREEESWVKWTAILSGLVVSWAPGAGWARPLASCSVLAAWVELLYLFANTPLGGLKLLMFFHVTKTVLKVLSTFIFLIVGFALSFTVLFEGKPPFQEIWPALSQTVAMMSELGYNDVFQVEELPHPLARPIFLLYLILVGTVLSNLLVGMSVSDVAELEAGGRALKTVREAKFLVVFEMLCYQKCLQPFLFWISRQSSYEDRESARIGRPLVRSKNPDPQEFLNAPPEVELCELPEGLLDRMMSEVERKEEDQRRRMRIAASEQGSPDSLRQTLYRTFSRARH